MSARAARWPVNTVLAGNGSPSDRLVISGGAATGNTSVHVTNVGGPGAETLGNGIQVVNAINGAPQRLTPSRSLGEPRGGAFDYDLFRGGIGGSSPNDWFLRSTSSCRRIRRWRRRSADPAVPSVDPPPNPLPPGVAFQSSGRSLPPMGWCSPWRGSWGFRSSARSTTGSATLTSRTVAPSSPRPRPIRRSAEQEVSGQAPDQEGADACSMPALCALGLGSLLRPNDSQPLQAFADPSASGNLGGFQGGIDLLRGPLIPGGFDRAGLYGAYGDVNADVTGLVTNPAATAYVLGRTGSMNLDAWSAGGYWTHVGNGGWYLDARASRDLVRRLDQHPVRQAATLTARASSAPWRAAIHSLWPQLGPGFVIEPQGQSYGRRCPSGTTMMGSATSRSATRRGRADEWDCAANGRS